MVFRARARARAGVRAEGGGGYALWLRWLHKDKFNSKKYFNESNKMEGKQETKDVKMVEVSLDLLKNLRNLLEVSNERMKWKLEELLPVGITIQQVDEILKKYEDK